MYSAAKTFVYSFIQRRKITNPHPTLKCGFQAQVPYKTQNAKRDKFEVNFGLNFL